MCSPLPEIFFCRGLSSANARKTLAIASLKMWGNLLACVREGSWNSHHRSRSSTSCWPSCSHLASHKAFPHTFSLTPHHLHGILPFLKQAFTEAPPAWRRAVLWGRWSWQELAGTDGNWLCPAQGSPSPQTPTAGTPCEEETQDKGHFPGSNGVKLTPL